MTETRDEYRHRRVQEILSEGGFDWRDFGLEEKIIAALQAEQEYDAKQIVEKLLPNTPSKEWMDENVNTTKT